VKLVGTIFRYIHGYTLQLLHRLITVKKGTLTIGDSLDTIYEKVVTPFGNSGKVDVPWKYIGK